MRASLASIFVLAIAIGCSPTKPLGSATGGGGDAFPTGGSTGGSSGGSTGGSSGGSNTGGDNLGGFGGQGGGAPVGETEVFGHSAATLYRLDPVTKQVTVVGDFDGCSGVIDLAIDKDGGMIATTFDGLYKIDKTTAKCAFIASGDYPNSLSFVPAGTLDPNVEALVGYEGSNYVRIDPASGQKTTIAPNTLGSYTSSGDVVSVKGGGTYLTVFGGPEGCGDCILEVDPKTGGVLKNIGALGHGSVYGLAFWGGSAYGFDDYGELFEINLTTGMTTVIPQPGAPQNLSYYGAGSSTSAPLEPPK